MTKEQVMTTALDMFSQYGIKSVSMDDIARNTGISKRTIYEFFDDKEGGVSKLRHISFFILKIVVPLFLSMRLFLQ